MTTFLERAKAAVNGAQRTAGAIVGAGLIAGVVRELFDVATRLHWIVVALLAVVVVWIAVWAARQVKKAPSARLSDVVGLLAFGVLTLAVAGAWVSFTLYQAHLATYEVPNPVVAGRFVDLYMYTFFDLIPSVHVWETVGVKSPIVAKGVVAGLPLLAFKVVVLWAVFAAFISWQKQQPATSASGVSAVPDVREARV